jgi:hypothetical protein
VRIQNHNTGGIDLPYNGVGSVERVRNLNAQKRPRFVLEVG